MKWKLKGQIRLFGSWGQQISGRGKILIEVAIVPLAGPAIIAYTIRIMTWMALGF